MNDVDVGGNQTETAIIEALTQGLDALPPELPALDAILSAEAPAAREAPVSPETVAAGVATITRRPGFRFLNRRWVLLTIAVVLLGAVFGTGAGIYASGTAHTARRAQSTSDLPVPPPSGTGHGVGGAPRITSPPSVAPTPSVPAITPPPPSPVAATTLTGPPRPSTPAPTAPPARVPPATASPSPSATPSPAATPFPAAAPAATPAPPAASTPAPTAPSPSPTATPAPTTCLLGLICLPTTPPR